MKINYDKSKYYSYCDDDNCYIVRKSDNEIVKEIEIKNLYLYNKNNKK